MTLSQIALVLGGIAFGIAGVVQQVTVEAWSIGLGVGVVVLGAVRVAVNAKGWRRDLLLAGVPGLAISLGHVVDSDSLLPAMSLGLLAASCFIDRVQET